MSAVAHTIAHWYNYERFVAYGPFTNVTKYGLPKNSYVPRQSTVVVPENTVSCYMSGVCSYVCITSAICTVTSRVHIILDYTLLPFCFIVGYPYCLLYNL